MKTLLIPTDFDVESLKSIPVLVNRFYPEQINIIMVHMMKITDSITELLMLSRRSTEYQHISQDFENKCNQLKKQFPGNIHSIRYEFFYGNTVATLDNFLDANEVNAIVLLNNYTYQTLNKYSVEPSILVNRCKTEKVFVDCAQVNKPEVVKTDNFFEEQSA
jgi:hypothetical protein